MIAGPCLRAADDTTDGRGAAVLMLASSQMNDDHAPRTCRSGNGWSSQTFYGSHRVCSMKTSVAAYLSFPIGLAMGYALQRHLGAKRTAVAPVCRVLGHAQRKNFRLGCWLRQNVWASIIDTLPRSVCRGVELLDLY